MLGALNVNGRPGVLQANTPVVQMPPMVLYIRERLILHFLNILANVLPNNIAFIMNFGRSITPFSKVK